MRKIIFSSIFLSFLIAQNAPVEAVLSLPKLSLPKVLQGKKTSDRDFSCAKRCTDPAEVCGTGANVKEKRDSCVKLCSAENKKKLLSKEGKTYDVNQYRYGTHGVLWPAIFNDVCAKPQRSFNIEIFNAYVATNFPDEVGFISGLSFEPEDIRIFANIAYLSYTARRSKLFATYKPLGWNIQKFPGTSALGSGHIAGLVMGKGNLIILAFHGTESAGDAITDAAFVKASASELGLSGSVHRGFLEAFKSSWPAIKKQIMAYAKKHVKDVKQLEYIVVGHSLGGALASLGAAKIASDSDLVLAKPNTQSNQVKAFTYASPRAFEEKAARNYNSKIGISNTVRFWISGDPVTTVPLGLLGYKHVGTSVKIPATSITTGRLENLSNKSLALTPKAHSGKFYVADSPKAYASHKVSPREHLGLKSRLKLLFR